MLDQLSVLALAPHGLKSYYEALLRSADITSRVAAMSALLELNAVRDDQFELVVELAKYGAVRSRAFRFFTSAFEYRFAERVAKSPVGNVSQLLTERMLAELSKDFLRTADLDQALFLETGALEHLRSAVSALERAGGWLKAAPVTITALLAHPTDSQGPFKLLMSLLDANQLDAVDYACSALLSAAVFQSEALLFRSLVLIGRKEQREALKILEKVKAHSGSDQLKTYFWHAKAQALEGLGETRQAYQAFERQNAVVATPPIDPKSYPAGVLRRSTYEIGKLPPDPNSHILMMVGFPRSGTTLLENALAAHSEIETFEEIPAFARMVRHIERTKNGPTISTEHATAARDIYYEELSRGSSGGKARGIDKMPLSSADAGFLKKMFPEKRWIFSIRDPRDVVLSCFKQVFQANSAMENFRSLESTCRLYDLAMTSWFDTWALDDQSICYVRYDDLVTNFRLEMKRVLTFLDLGWEEAVSDFARKSEQRAALTPSYQKLRAGLTIGVQSSWRDYRFLFASKETKALNRWIDHFGYGNE